MMLAAFLGALVGLILGLTGAGGSVIAVPLLIWGMGWTLP
ncbi:MAG TPA: sulfite exporter TauE/SafE family protein, partial [Gammaproteobacteria bacterium]|nr:sulfite exporter TauE/SafE family protein [Gammaproteobacteria bacterium]